MATETLEERSEYLFFPQRAPRNPRPAQWRYNCLHDLESVWWVGVWAAHIFTYELAIPSETSLPLSTDKTKFLSLFPRAGASVTKRSDAFTILHHFKKIYLPSGRMDIAKMLADWKLELIDLYLCAEEPIEKIKRRF